MSVDRGGIDVHPDAGLPEIHCRKGDNESQQRDGQEVPERFQGNPPDPLHVVHPRHAMHDAAEDDWPDDHPNEIDEGIAERLGLLGESGSEMS